VSCGKQVGVDAFVVITCDELQKMKLEANHDSVTVKALAGGRHGVEGSGVAGQEEVEEEEVGLSMLGVKTSQYP